MILRLFLFLAALPSMHQASAQDSFQLASPLVRFSSLVYKSSTQVICQFNQPGTQIRYTLDGTEPNQQSAVYQGPVSIRGKQVQFKARVFGASFLPSETVALHFIRQGMPINKITGTLPAPQYRGKGLTTLIDGQAGNTDIGNGQWLGYEGDSAIWTLTLAKASAPKELLLHCLQQHGSWIFLPQQIKVYAFNKTTQQYVQAGEAFTAAPNAELPGAVVPIKLSLKPFPPATQFKIICHPLAQIPAWHSGAGGKAWMFVDEIILY